MLVLLRGRRGSFLMTAVLPETCSICTPRFSDDHSLLFACVSTFSGTKLPAYVPRFPRCLRTMTCVSFSIAGGKCQEQNRLVNDAVHSCG